MAMRHVQSVQEIWDDVISELKEPLGHQGCETADSVQQHPAVEHTTLVSAPGHI